MFPLETASPSQGRPFEPQHIDDVIESLFAPLLEEPVPDSLAPLSQPSPLPPSPPPVPAMVPSTKAARGKTAQKMMPKVSSKPSVQLDPECEPENPEPCVPNKHDPYEERIQAIKRQVIPFTLCRSRDLSLQSLYTFLRL
jgi:hypothetical protein